MSQETIEIGRFGGVDSSGQAEQMLAFLDWWEQLPQIEALRRSSHDLLGMDARQRVVDVGCGTGAVVADLAREGIEAIGVDVSEHLIEVARSRYPGHAFRVASAESLPFADGSLHCYRAERLYQHLREPAPALDEARRVLAPGGRMVLVDMDADTWAVDAEDVAVTRALAHAFSDTMANPWMGRRCQGLLLDAGFIDVNVELVPTLFTRFEEMAPAVQGAARAGVAAAAVTPEQAAAWLADQRHRGERQRFFSILVMVLATATAPAS